MSQITKCDRCGAVGADFYKTIRLGNAGEDDLCFECISQFDNFMEMLPVEVVEEE